MTYKQKGFTARGLHAALAANVNWQMIRATNPESGSEPLYAVRALVQFARDALGREAADALAAQAAAEAATIEFSRDAFRRQFAVRS